MNNNYLVNLSSVFSEGTSAVNTKNTISIDRAKSIMTDVVKEFNLTIDNITIKDDIISRPINKRLVVRVYGSYESGIVIYLNAIVASVNSEPELTNLLKKTIAHEYWHMWQYKNIPNDLLEEDLKKPYRDRIMEKDAREYAWTFLIGKGEDYKSLFLNKEVKKGDVVVSKSKKSKTKKLTKEQEYQEYLDRKATFKLQQFTKEALFEIGLESNISVSKKMSKEEMAEKLVQGGIKPYHNGSDVRLVSFDNGKEFFRIQEWKFKKENILNNEHIKLGYKLEDKSNVLITTVDAKRIYWVRNEDDMKLLYIVQKNEPDFLTNITKQGDSWEPDMRILGKYFDAIIFTNEFVLKSGIVVTPWKVNSAVVLLKDRKREIKEVEIDNTKAKEKRIKIDIWFGRNTSKLGVIETLNINAEKIIPKDKNYSFEITDIKSDFVNTGDCWFKNNYEKECKWTHPISKKELTGKYYDNACIFDLSTDEKVKIKRLTAELYMNGIYINIKHPIKGYEIKGTFVPLLRTPGGGRTRKLWMIKISDDDISNQPNLIETARTNAKIELADGDNFYDKEIVRNKVDSYLSLRFSTSKSIFNEEEMQKALEGFKIGTAKDPDFDMSDDIEYLTMVKHGDGDNVSYTMEKGTDKIIITPHDGQSYADLKWFLKVRVKQGKISPNDYDHLLKAYEEADEDLEEMMENLNPHWKSVMYNKVGSDDQVRTNMLKGTMVLFNKKWANGTKFEGMDIVIGLSSIKYPVKSRLATMDPKDMMKFYRVCASNKAPKKGRFSQQILLGLSLSDKDIIKISNRRLNEIIQITKNPIKAIQYLSSVYDTDDDLMDIEADDVKKQIEEEKETDIRTKLAKMLELDPRILQTPYAQNKLFEMLDKEISDMRLAKIHYDLKNQLVMSDPRSFFNKYGAHNNELHKGECWYNGLECEALLTRHPYIHPSGLWITDFISDNELDLIYKNVVVVNCFEPLLLRLGGADTDGDKLGIITDEVVIDAARSSFNLPLLYTPKANAVLKKDAKEGDVKIVPYTYEVECEFYASTVEGNHVGQYTNIGLIIRDIMLCTRRPKITGVTVDEDGIWIKDMDKHLNTLLMIIDQIIGKEVDKEKTGEDVQLPAILKNIKKKPHWHKDVDARFNTIDEILERNKNGYYISDSPLAKNYDSISTFKLGPETKSEVVIQKTLIEEKLDECKYDPSLYWSPFVNKEVAWKIYDQVKIHVKEYNKELAILIGKENRYIEQLKTKDAKQIADEAFRHDFTTIFEKYTDIFASFKFYGASETDITYCVYVATKEVQKNVLVGNSCPWTTCFEGMRDLSIIANPQFRYVRLRTDADEVIVNHHGDIMTSDKMIKRSTADRINMIPAGIYPVVHDDDSDISLIKVSLDSKALLDARREYRRDVLNKFTESEKLLINIYGMKECGFEPEDIKTITSAKIINNGRGTVIKGFVNGEWKKIGICSVPGKSANSIRLHTIEAALVNTMVSMNVTTVKDSSVQAEVSFVKAIDEEELKVFQNSAKSKELIDDPNMINLRLDAEVMSNTEEIIDNEPQYEESEYMLSGITSEEVEALGMEGLDSTTDIDNDSDFTLSL